MGRSDDRGWRYLCAASAAFWVFWGSIGAVEWWNATAFGFAAFFALVLVTEP